MLLEEAGVEQPLTEAMAEPETDAVAKQCASGCNQQGRPQLQRTQCDQGTDREQRQRGGDERADDEQRVGQRDSEQQPERIVGMGIDPGEQAVQRFRHFASAKASAAASSVRTISSSPWRRSEEHTSELESLMRISYAVFCLQ